MQNPKVLLFYKFTPLADPDAIHHWQRVLCESLNLVGRIIISPHGINATLGGALRDLKAYSKATRLYGPFKDLDLKWSVGTGADFPRLSVKVRPELVSFGVPNEIQVTRNGVVGGGEHVDADALDRLIETHGEDLVFFDGRNAFEAAIGKFRDAIVPNVKTTHDFITELDSGKYDDLKKRPIVTYCTGGIRCEILSVLMKNRGFESVYQLDGGIARYGEARRDGGLWTGSLFVFDERMALTFSPQAQLISHCEICGTPSDHYVNCVDLACRALIVMCAGCESGGRNNACAPTHAQRR